MKEKVYKVVVVLEVYGQSSKKGAEDFLEEVLSVDGLSLEKVQSLEVLKEATQ